MALTLDATVAGASSNSYVTLARGNQFFEQLVQASDLMADFTVNRSQLFIQATRLIDRHFRPDGDRLTSTQALEWPRKNIYHDRTGATLASDSIPEFVEWATVEWAYSLYQDAETEDMIAPGLSRLRTTSYEIEMAPGRKRKIPESVLHLLLPYGTRDASHVIRLMRA